MSEIKVNKLSSRTGNAVTLGTSGDTFTIPSGVTLTNSGTATGFGSDSDISWQSVVTSNTTMVAGRGYFVDSSGGAITMTLPASPTIGDSVAVHALDGQTNAVTIARNSSNIEGGTNNLSLASNYAAITLIFTDASNGWVRHNNEVPDTFIAATGGTATTSGDYKIHTFNSSSNFVVSTISSSSHTAEYLVIGGGGGSANNRGGGGGAGGYRTNYPAPATGGLTLAAQTYPITVGAGAAGTPTPSTPSVTGADGSTSTFSTITSAGGGGGGYDGGGRAGGSGGGAGYPGHNGGAGNTPPVSPSQGNPGGNNSSNDSGSGGGGAGSAGVVGVNQNAGNGGNGLASTITGSSVTRGGGGGGSGGDTAGTAGPGGGGAGYGGPNGANPDQNGDANTGGGAGASRNVTSGTGGSGVVIIRYKYQ